jgi:hypothetical protein
MANTKFEEFVKAQKARQQKSGPFDPVARLAEWKSKVEELYTNIRGFLKSHISSGDIIANFDTIEVAEQILGSYMIRRLSLKIGTQTVIFKPVAAMVIGSHGRVDLQGGAGSVKLVLVKKDANDRRMEFATGAPDTQDPFPAAELVWKIATPPPTMQLIELTQDSLMDAILEASNG